MCGSHSTGKTTLMNALKKEFPKFNFVSEAARDCPYPINENTGFLSQDFIFRTQVCRELKSELNDVTITDRTTFDQLAYIEYAYRDAMTIHESKYALLKKYALAWANTYDVLFYVPIEFDLVNDGVRSTDDNYRRKIDEYIVKLLDEKNRRYYTIAGTVEERLKQVKDKIYDVMVMDFD